MSNQEPEDFDKTIEIVRRRQRYFRRPQNTANIVARVLTNRSVAASQSNQQLNDIWEQAVGQRFASQTKPGVVRRAILEVYVANSAILQQLTFNKKSILEKIKKTELLNNLKDIRFKIGTV